ncbi:MAG: tol-pal system-associated acyl-CoA thioesterase [Alphaproteobacteria bacterium]|nr:tol-pal system-associated acyl-CoA thioesterase [Alphaproteobacteria bacterium]
MRVYYEDTDAAGIVYYANYLKFAERARTEMLRKFATKAGFRREETGLTFVVQRCSVEYRRPAKLDDLIDVHTHITRVGAASLALRQEVHRDGTLLVPMDIRLALVDREMKPARLPPALIAALTPQYKSGK